MDWGSKGYLEDHFSSFFLFFLSFSFSLFFWCARLVIVFRSYQIAQYKLSMYMSNIHHLQEGVLPWMPALLIASWKQLHQKNQHHLAMQHNPTTYIQIQVSDPSNILQIVKVSTVSSYTVLKIPKKKDKWR